MACINPRVLFPLSHMHACACVQVSVIRTVEVEVEAALDKLRGAAKDLNKGLRELAKLLADDQKQLTKYTPGRLSCGSHQCWHHPAASHHVIQASAWRAHTAIHAQMACICLE